MSNATRNEASIEFMLAEFNSLQSHVIKLEDAKSNRVNFFLIVIAAVSAGIPSLVGSPNYQNISSLIIAMASFSLFILGVTILNQLIIYSESIIGLYRRAGRIRRWFVEADKTITLYLPFAASDDRPGMRITAGYLELRGGDVIIRMVNSILFAIFVTATVVAIYPLIRYPFIIISLFPLAIVAWYAQQIIVKSRLNYLEKRMKRKIRFPQVEAAEELISLPE